MPEVGSELITSPCLEDRQIRPRRLICATEASKDEHSPSGAVARKSAHAPMVAPSLLGLFLRWFQTGTLGQQQPQGCLTVILAHGGLEVGGRQKLRMGTGLMGAPLHEEAVAEAPEQAGHKHGVGVANPATIIVMGNVQTLVQAVFDAAKTGPVQLQPFLGIELFGGSAGNEANVFILATLGLAQQAGRLRRQGKTNLLRADRLGPDRAAQVAVLFVLEGAILRGRRLPRGENPPWGRGVVAGCSGGV